MRKPFLSRGPLILFCSCLVCLLTLPLSGQRAKELTRPVSMIGDWSTHHTVYVRVGPMQAMLAAQQDPRAMFAWRQGVPQGAHFMPPIRIWRPEPPPIHHPIGMSTLHRDWSINLGTAGTAPGMYPAKFSFDVTATASCANDFVVFPVNANGSATQPTIVAFNYLYSGTTGANGICNNQRAGTSNGTSAAVYWSYDVSAITGGGAIPTSPVIAYDPPLGGGVTGTKVAFVESVAGSPAHFHVLAWKAGDGFVTGGPQNALKPVVINTFVSASPAAGSGTATDLTLGSSTTGTDTLSSPFIDYFRDLAYVGNDLGTLYRIKDVFCTSVNPDCKSASPAPSIDTSWGSGGSVSVCTGKLTAPVLDYTTMNVFVGCSDGKLYSVSQTGTIKSITVGDGVASETYGGIVDPPIVDGVNGFVYAVSGSANNGANGVLVQAKTDLSSSVAATVGTGNQCNIHAPTPNNAYFTSITSAGALMYVAGVNGTVPQPCTASSNVGGPTITVYGVTFNTTTGVMNAGAPAHSFGAGGGPGYEWAPLLEFYNATTAIDWLFVAALQSNQTDMGSANITAGFPTGVATVVTEGIGTSGMIVDNNSSSAQAASIYFNALQENAACNNNTVLTDTGGCAVKLTQAALQ